MTHAYATSPEVHLLVARAYGDESWELLLQEQDNQVRIFCTTQGEQTLAAHGVPWHAACVTVRNAQLLRLRAALAGPLGDAFAPLPELLTRFFAHGELYLADLLDILDGEGIPYSYQSHDSQATLFRPEGA